MFEAREVFEIFQRHRGNTIVLAEGRAGYLLWPEISTNPKRDAAIGETMGQGTSAALGLALALPDEKVVLFDAEGSLLMNLGALATIAEKQPKNFYHFLLDNECYATTGGQPVPSAKNTAYADLAQAAGYPSTYSFDDLEEFATNLEGILNEPGPVFIHMKIVPDIENVPIGLREEVVRRSTQEVIRDLRENLGIAAHT